MKIKIEKFTFNDKESGYTYDSGDKNYFYSAKSLYEQAEKEKAKKFKFYLRQFRFSDRWSNSSNHEEMANMYLRIKNADIKIPIILEPDGTVADGNHRIVKALVQGKDYIYAYRLKKFPEPTEVKDLK